MTRKELYDNIRRKGSFLCVGLDPDPKRMPVGVKGDLLAFNKAIIDATAQYAIAFKPNLAFYETQGAKGLQVFEDTVRYIAGNYPDIMIIADAKRGDIGNTSRMYASSFFDHYNVDAVTVAPYMGRDSVEPFLGYEGKWVMLLALTSNPGSADFQMISDKDGKCLFEHVIEKSSGWGTPDNMMYVVGATRAEMLQRIREIIPNHFLLVPGVGAQGGSLEQVVEYGLNNYCGLIVNSSRGIIHASQEADFAQVAETKAREMRDSMTVLLQKYGCRLA